MACLEMYNNSQKHSSSSSSSSSSNLHRSSSSPPMSPRISFSNDFVETSHYNSQRNSLVKPSRSSSALPVSSDFEFSVSNHNMMSADELFFKGTILPFSFKEDNNGGNRTNMQMQRTIRDELLVSDDHNHNHNGFSLKPPKPTSSSSSSSNGWKGFLGLRKSHIGSKKTDKIDSSFHPNP